MLNHNIITNVLYVSEYYMFRQISEKLVFLQASLDSNNFYIHHRRKRLNRFGGIPNIRRWFRSSGMRNMVCTAVFTEKWGERWVKIERYNDSHTPIYCNKCMLKQL